MTILSPDNTKDVFFEIDDSDSTFSLIICLNPLSIIRKHTTYYYFFPLSKLKLEYLLFHLFQIESHYILIYLISIFGFLKKSKIDIAVVSQFHPPQPSFNMFNQISNIFKQLANFLDIVCKHVLF